MNRFFLISFQALLLVALTFTVAAGQDEANVEKYSVWLGASYTDFTDYTKKVAEYRTVDDDFLPEFEFNYLSQRPNSLFLVNGKYIDEKRHFAELSSKNGDAFSLDFKYNSLYKQAGQDNLANLETREAGGGKIITHEIMDPGADYGVQRKDIRTDLNVRLSRKNNIRLIAAHRTTLQTGTEQHLSSNHCFSCHITSNTAMVDKITHEIMAGLQADFGRSTVGYQFSYRYFNSEAPNVMAHYDAAVHPVNGGSGAEFSSRMIYDNTNLPSGVYPKTEKLSHKVSLRGEAGKGTYGSSFSVSKATNKHTDVAGKSFSGAAFYSTPLKPTMRLIAKFSVAKLDVDDYFVDLPTFREGRPGTPKSFDFTRQSSLNRVDIRGSAEIVSRLNPTTTASILVGLNSIDREYYPSENADPTSTLYGQLKVRYRKGMNYSASFKYRYESTSNPFTSARGLFEARGIDILHPVDGTPNVYYWQRAELRYQAITTAPTSEHIFDITSNWRPNNKVNMNVGIKADFAKNGDLDSLDVKHSSIQPSLALNFNPDLKWTISAGGSYTMMKSTGPIAIPLFDG